MAAITFDVLPDLIKRLADECPKAVRTAAVEAAAQGVGVVTQTIDATTPYRPVDTGGYRASWRSERTEDGARVFSDAPHAVFIERGTRPHWIGWNTQAGRALRLWAVRKFGHEDGPRVAYFVRRKIAARGTAPRHVAERATPEIGDAFVEAAMRQIAETK